MENHSNKTSKDSDALQKELIKSHGLNEGGEILYCVCLPMNSASELQISLYRANQLKLFDKVIMEVVPFELWPTLKLDHVENVKKNQEIEKEDNNFEKERLRDVEPKLEKEEQREVKNRSSKEEVRECSILIMLLTVLLCLAYEISNDLDALQKELMVSHGLKDGKDIRYFICLPMNSTSELQISLSKGYEWQYSDRIVMEAVPLELWPTLKLDHVENEIKKEDNNFKEKWFRDVENEFSKEEVRECSILIMLLTVLLCLACFLCFLHDYLIPDAASRS
ncbi:hypothetical protein CAEBREN_05668 [Caenorhabditis brenneri]|uniref:Uncharacterized protein n=1 Tax=Caenorhabditis brenneri TaxID=135651 RepID=G0MDN1_CAEBE|nr:hypothetical protein CAEBREN_05668 [Caenorhabditis brenneri]